MIRHPEAQSGSQEWSLDLHSVAVQGALELAAAHADDEEVRGVVDWMVAHTSVGYTVPGNFD